MKRRPAVAVALVLFLREETQGRPRLVLRLLGQLSLRMTIGCDAAIVVRNARIGSRATATRIDRSRRVLDDAQKPLGPTEPVGALRAGESRGSAEGHSGQTPRGRLPIVGSLPTKRRTLRGRATSGA